MRKKGVRVAIEAVLVVVLVLVGRAMAGVLGDVIIVLGLILLVYTIVDLFRKQK
jgi:purine-cytosine permease-like protein